MNNSIEAINYGLGSFMCFMSQEEAFKKKLNYKIYLKYEYMLLLCAIYIFQEKNTYFEAYQVHR